MSDFKSLPLLKGIEQELKSKPDQTQQLIKKVSKQGATKIDS